MTEQEFEAAPAPCEACGTLHTRLDRNYSVNLKLAKYCTVKCGNRHTSRRWHDDWKAEHGEAYATQYDRSVRGGVE